MICPDFKHHKLSMSKMGKVCKYHKLFGQEFVDEQIGSGLCPHLHNVAYPHALARLYGADKSLSEKTLACPKHTNVEISIITRKKFGIAKWTWFYLLKKSTKIIGLPWDGELFSIHYIVKNKDTGEQQVFDFNIDDKMVLCPATLYTIFPPISGKAAKVHCCDHEGMEYSINY